MPSPLEQLKTETLEKVNLHWEHIKHAYAKDPDAQHVDTTVAYLKGTCPHCDLTDTFVAWNDGRAEMVRQPLCSHCGEAIEFIGADIKDAGRFGPPSEATKKAKVQREYPPAPEPIVEVEVYDVSRELTEQSPTDQALAGLPPGE